MRVTLIAITALMLLTLLVSSVISQTILVRDSVSPSASTFQPVATLTPELIPTGERDVTTYPVRGTAPELNNLVWLNTDAPLHLSDLRGQVVLLEFWTFDCINCIHTIPYIEQWYETYQEQGLVVIGNHFPELRHERDVQNIRAALTRMSITYPIAVDNAGETWRTYNQRYWPTLYLIDKWGAIRYLRIGEGQYEQTEAAIKVLLSEAYTPAETDTATEEAAPDTSEQFLTTDIDLNVRSGAGTEFDAIGSTHPGMALVVLGESNGWYQITYNDATGYVSGDYVQLHSRS